jgi:negative regulator of sigma-B (phosphoserine phosphatase)
VAQVTAVREQEFIEWAWAGAPLEGDESGDLHVVALLSRGALIAVIDGLGHGPEAAVAAKEAAMILRANAELPMRELIERCHEGLRKTRGAVMSIASLDLRSSTIEWCGVGNVEGVLLRARGTAERRSEAIGTRGGVVGYRLPPLHVSTVAVAVRDVLVLATDGIRGGFTDGVDVDLEPQAIADAVFASHAKGSDDALVLVVRYLGSAS